MPRAKRDREVSLTQTKKKTKESKENLVRQVREALEEYDRLFVFNFENLRSAKFTQVRQKFKADSKFFLAKKSVMALALGRSKENEVADDLHAVSQCLLSSEGQCGIMFTNQKKAAIQKFFEQCVEDEHPRTGNVAAYSVSLSTGPLPQFTFSMEPQLRKLGLPTKMEKGKVELYTDFKVCDADETLTAEQCKILKLLDEKMCQFKVNLLAHWTPKKGFEPLAE